MQNLSRRIWRTKAGTRVIGVSIERSWHQGHHTMDGPPSPHPTPTPPQKRKIIVICKICPEEPGETKAGTRVIGVSIERSWPQCHHKMDGPHPTPTPHPPPHTSKINVLCKTCPKESGEPRQVRGWLGCLWKGLDLWVTTQWTDPFHPHHFWNLARTKEVAMTSVHKFVSTLTKTEVAWPNGGTQRYSQFSPYLLACLTFFDWVLPYGKALWASFTKSHLEKNQNQCYMQNLSWRILEKPRQVRGWLGCLWKDLFLRVTTQWMDSQPHPTHSPPPPQKCKIIVICKTCPEEPGETKAGARVIGVSMERSLPQGHHTMDGPPTNLSTPTPTPKTQNQCQSIICKPCP